VLGAGESAANIATTFGVTLDAIQTANPGVNLRRLKSGDTLQVPDSLQGH
jgi:LysM repeat protein